MFKCKQCNYQVYDPTGDLSATHMDAHFRLNRKAKQDEMRLQKQMQIDAAEYDRKLKKSIKGIEANDNYDVQCSVCLEPLGNIKWCDERETWVHEGTGIYNFGPAHDECAACALN